MAEPKDYRILLNLKAAIQAIAVAAGYFYSLDDAAVKLDPEHSVEELIKPGGPRPFVLIEQREDEFEYHPANEVYYDRRYTIHWIHEPAPLADAIVGEPAVPVDEDRPRIFERGLSDIERALAADNSLGGLAVDTRITGRRWNTNNGGQEVWAEIDIAVKVYREFGATT